MRTGTGRSRKHPISPSSAGATRWTSFRPGSVVARWFAAEQAELDALRAAHAAAAEALEAFIEEHAPTTDRDDGLQPSLTAAVNDRGRVTRGSVTARLLEVEPDPENQDELELLLRCLALMDAETAAGRTVKAAQAQMDSHVLARYSALTDAATRTLVVDDKWFASIRDAVANQVDQRVRQLTERLKKLDERYARPLPDLKRMVHAFTAKVDGHLKDRWKVERLGDIATFLKGASVVLKSGLSADGTRRWHSLR